MGLVWVFEQAKRKTITCSNDSVKTNLSLLINIASVNHILGIKVDFKMTVNKSIYAI